MNQTKDLHADAEGLCPLSRAATYPPGFLAPTPNNSLHKTTVGVGGRPQKVPMRCPNVVNFCGIAIQMICAPPLHSDPAVTLNALPCRPRCHRNNVVPHSL